MNISLSRETVLLQNYFMGLIIGVILVGLCLFILINVFGLSELSFYIKYFAIFYFSVGIYLFLMFFINFLLDYNRSFKEKKKVRK